MSKQVADLKARFALRGFAVHSVDGGGLLVCKWNLSRFCRDIEALEAFLKQIGG